MCYVLQDCRNSVVAYPQDPQELESAETEETPEPHRQASTKPELTPTVTHTRPLIPFPPYFDATQLRKYTVRQDRFC